MRVSIINIGNSKGFRIPKVALEESGIIDEAEMTVKKREIKLVPIKNKKKFIDPITLASEEALAKDWLRPEEEEAWKVYQLDK